MKGDEVRIAGVRVGQVTGISLARQDQEPTAAVDLEVSADVPVPAKVQATIRYRNLVGQRYIALTDADGSGGRTLTQGELIPLAQTKPALDLTILFGGFRPLLQALSPADMNRLSYEIIQVFQGEGGTVESLLSHVASLTNSLADKDAVIGSMIDNLTKVMSTVANRDQQLSDLVVSLQQFVTGLAGDRDAIFDSLQTIDTLATTTTGFLGRRRPPLQADIQALGKLSGNLADTKDVVEHFLQLAPVKIDLITRTAINGSWFNFFMCSANGYGHPPGHGRAPATAVTVPPMKSWRGGVRLMARESKPFRDRNPVTIGAISLAVIATLVFLAFNAQSLPLIGGGTVYKAQFSEAAGLKPDDPVRVAGVKVGKVESLALEHGAVTVEFRVKDAFVGDRSEAAIKIETVLGAKYLALVPRGGQELDPKKPDPARSHGRPYDVVEAFADLSTTVENIDTKQLATSFEVLSQTFSETPDEVRSSLQGLARLSDTIASRDAQLRQLLGATRKVTDVLADRNGEFTKLIVDSNTLLTEVQRRRRAHRLDPHEHPGPVDPALRTGRRQPRGPHAHVAGALGGHRLLSAQPRQPRRDGQQPRALRPGLHQHPRQRPLVRQLRQRPAPAVLGSAVCGGAAQTPLPVGCSGEYG